ncbi:MAG: PQQ-binding-like beta-propeller repeat protein [Candidatus Bathyarchaeota archaeon]|nr:PQQ-binding-like beta-propeller repeat protein [Candidatus Bathyarchaeota archaeon]
MKKNNVVAIALLLILGITAIFSSLPQPAQAQTTFNYQTFAYLSMRPNPIGVNQPLLLNFWITPPMPFPGIIAHGYTVEITHPNGNKETLGPFNSIQADTSMWTEWTPKTVGTYKIKVIYPGETVPPGTPYQGTGITSAFNQYTVHTYIFNRAESPVTELVVQEDPLPGYQPTPLPTEYWARPVSIENREWAQLMGNWVMSGNGPNSAYFQPYGGGPESAHILWALESGVGGIVGDQYSYSIYSGDPISTNTLGVTKYMRFAVAGMGFYPDSSGWHCIDLRTGQERWVKTLDGGTPTIATVENYVVRAQGPPIDSYNAYLMQIGTVFRKWDAYTGNLIVNTTGLSGTYDPTPYYKENYGMQTFVYSTSGSGANRRLIKWTTQGTSTNFTSRIEYNVTYPLNGITGIDGKIGYYFGVGFETVAPSGAFDIETGQILWMKNYTINEAMFSSGGVISNGVHFYPLYYGDPNQQGLRPVIGIDIATGKILHNTTVTDYPWGSFWSYSKAAGYGMAYYPTYTGHVWAFNLTTGKIVWKGGYNPVGYQTPYGYQPFFSSIALAGGKVYAGNDEHSEGPPYYQGKKMWCLDAYTGETIWNITFWSPGFNMQGLIADGKLIATNYYDGIQYCFDKGSSATSVTASPKVSVHGSSVIIEGMVTDTSPGTKNLRPAALYPNGVPCVSDESQGVFMEYVYMQKQKPTNVTGVPVTLSVLDSNGNYREIGTATTVDGFYALNWTPEIEGTYTIYASFDGSKSYWPSHAVTSIAVDPAPETPAPETETPLPPIELYIAGATIAIIIAIAIVGIMLASIVKKRP